MQLILPLLLLVVITPTVAFATNESSYKFGYKAAYEGYKCHAEENDCGAPSSNIEEQCSDQVTHGAVDNQTACADGWVNGMTYKKYVYEI